VESVVKSLKLLTAASIMAVVFTSVALYYLVSYSYYSYYEHVLSFATPIPPLFSSAFLGLYIASIILVYYIDRSVKALALGEQGYGFLLRITRASYIAWLVSALFVESPLPQEIASAFLVTEYVSAVTATIGVAMHMYRLGEASGSKVIKVLAIVALLTLAINTGVLSLGTVNALKLYAALWIFTGFESWRTVLHLQAGKVAGVVKEQTSLK
jgi:hypothetical protein